MKKLLLLAIVMLGGVMQVNAAEVSRRIFIELQGALATDWSWKNQAPVVWIGSSANTVSTFLQMDSYDRDSKKNKLYYADITGEDLSDLTLIITSGENINDDYHAVTVSNVNLTETNKIFYVYISDNKCAVGSGDYTYKFIYWAEGGDHITTDLTYDGNNLKGTYSNSGTKFGLVFPSLVTSGQPFANFYWAFAHRPANSGFDYAISDFQVYSSDLTGSDKSFKFTEDMDYELSFTISSTPKFTITPYRKTNIGGAGYATWSNGEKYKIDNTNLEDVYVVSAKNTGYVTLTSKKGSVFPAGEGVIIKGSGEVKIKATNESASEIGTNFLVGSGNSTATPATGDNYYVFNWDGTDASSVGFYKASGGTLAAHKAYLDLGKNGGAGARDFLGFSFDDETTGINEVKVSQNDGVIYNLQGIRQNKLQKGINIVNGKKVLVK